MTHIPQAVCMNVGHHPDAMGHGVGREMVPIKNDFILEMITKATQDGFKVDHPYYKVSTDLYECPECGFRACVGFAKQALVEHWEPGYKETKNDAKSRFRNV